MAKELPSSIIVENLVYDESSPSGLTWKTNYSLRSKAGTPAGTLNKNGYWVVRLNNSLYYAHRIVMFLTNGEFPTELYIDHIDNNRSNNLRHNLRLATRELNTSNKICRKANLSGFKFLSKDTNRKRYSVRWMEGKNKFLKIFKLATMEETLTAALCFREQLIQSGKLIYGKQHDREDAEPYLIDFRAKEQK